MRIFPAVLVLAAAFWAAPASADEIPDTPEPWLYAVAMPPTDSPAITAAVDIVIEEPEPVVEPPTIAPIGAESRTLALTLPATGVLRELHGETVAVVAWLEADTNIGFVFERTDGTRGYVTSWDEPAMSYVFPVTVDPCSTDPFGVLPPSSC